MNGGRHRVSFTPPRPGKRLVVAVAGVVAALFFTGFCRAADLLEVYRMAVETSPDLQAARSALAAERAGRDEARAGLLPRISAAGAVDHTDTTIKGFGDDFSGGAVPGTLFPDRIQETYYSGGYSVRLVQPLVNGRAWSAVEAADARINAADAGVAAKEQDLILRVVDAYFELLRARAEEAVVRVRKRVLAETLAAAEANLKVGAGDIIAVHEARAGYDAVEASLINARNMIRIARSRLQRLTHAPVGAVADVKALRALGPDPDRIAPWRRAAMDHHPLLIQARRRLDAARERIRFERRARWPEVAAKADYGYDKGRFLPGVEQWRTRIGFQLSVPLFEGGAIGARLRRARADADALRHQRRELADRIILETDNAFWTLQNSVSRLAAATQARASARISLQATRKGFRLGNRTIIDLLAAVQAMEDADRTYHEARYDQVTARAGLKAAAGVISVKDVAALNELLEEE